MQPRKLRLLKQITSSCRTTPSPGEVRVTERDDRLILTKIMPPEPVKGLVERRVTSEALAEIGVRHLVVVAGGAGYGKTCLLTALARAHQPVAWLTITSADRDPDLFLALLEQALARALGHAPPPPLTLGLSARSAEPGGRAAGQAGARLVNWLTRVGPRHLLLILDDYHKVSDVPEVSAVLHTLLEHLPPGLRVVLGTRVVPDLPLLPRWLASGRATIISEDRLRFDRHEAAALLAAACGLQPDDATLDRLLEGTEGWALGLQLLGQVLRGRPAREPISPAGLSAELLFNYFSAEILNLQSPAMRRFLIEASVLNTLTPAACNAVLGRNDALGMLRAVESQGLFVVRLGSQSWRFHNLFRRFLAQELAGRPERLQALHRAAGAYFTDLGDSEEAIVHWLSGGELTHAAQCMHTAAPGMIQAGRSATLAHWLSLFPAAYRAADPHLLYWQGRLLEVQGTWHEALACYRRAEVGYQSRGLLAGQVEVNCRRAHIAAWLQGLPRKAQRYLRRVKELLEQDAGLNDHNHLRQAALTCLALGNPEEGRRITRRAVGAYLREGNREDAAWALLHPGSWLEFIRGNFTGALELLDEACRLAGPEAGVYFTAEYQTSLAAQLLFLDRIASSRAAGQRALALAEQLDSVTLRAWAHRTLGYAWLREPEANLEQAEHHLGAALALAASIWDARVVLTANIGLLLLARRRQDRAGIARAIERARTQMRRTGDRWLTLHVSTFLGLALLRTDPAQAEKRLRSALRIAVAMANHYHRPLAHFGLAVLQRDDPAALHEHLPHVVRGVEHCGPGLLTDDFQPELELLLAAARRAGLPAALRLAALVGASPAVAPLACCVFGSFTVTVGGAPVPAAAWGGAKARDLCRLLAAHHPAAVPKEKVLEALWGHLPQAAAENNFHKTLHKLRRILDPAGAEPRDRYVALQTGIVGLAADAGVDAASFVQHVEQARQAEARADAAGARQQWLAAERLCRGDFLAEEPYAEWAHDLRNFLQGQRLWVLDKLADCAIADQDYSGACLYLERLLAIDPTQEGALRRLVECHHRAGRRRQAFEQYRRLCRVLRTELGVEPAPETVALSRRLFVDH